jgi:hypothetical protein
MIVKEKKDLSHTLLVMKNATEKRTDGHLYAFLFLSKSNNEKTQAFLLAEQHK